MEKTKKEENKVVLAIKNYFINLKNTKKNFDIVKSNPYAYQKFSYNLYKWVIIIIGFIVGYQFFKIVTSFSAGSNPMAANLGRAFTVLVAIIFMNRLYQMIKAQKAILDHYDASPATINQNIPADKINIKDEVDNILDKYDDQGNIKKNNKGGEQ